MSRSCLIITAVLLFAACGDGSDAVSTGVTSTVSVSPTSIGEGPTTTSLGLTSTSGDAEIAIDGCALVTPEEAAVILGEPSTNSGNGAVVGGGVKCEWSGPPRGSSNVQPVMLVQVYGGSEFYPRAGYDETYIEDVGGLGDEAFVGESYGTIAWVQDDVTVAITVTGGATTEQLVTLAQSVSERL